jgi:hypothetical protein
LCVIYESTSYCASACSANINIRNGRPVEFLLGALENCHDRPLHAATRGLTEPVNTTPSVARMAVPEWILIVAALSLNYLVATEIVPILRQILYQLLFMLLYRLERFFPYLISPYFIFLIGLTIALVLQTILIYGAWAVSRTRRLSFVILIGTLLALETVASRSWIYSSGDPTFWYVLAFPLITAIATAISYARARKTVSCSTAG